MTLIDQRPRYAEAEGRSGPFAKIALEVDSQRFVEDLVGVLTRPLPPHAPTT